MSASTSQSVAAAVGAAATVIATAGLTQDSVIGHLAVLIQAAVSHLPTADQIQQKIIIAKAVLAVFEEGLDEAQDFLTKLEAACVCTN